MGLSCSTTGYFSLYVDQEGGCALSFYRALEYLLISLAPIIIVNCSRIMRFIWYIVSIIKGGIIHNYNF